MAEAGWACVALYSAALMVAYVWRWAHDPGFVPAFDFRVTVWNPAGSILGGRSPYPVPVPDVVSTTTYAYPPPLALLGVPLRSLPFAAAAALWLGGLAAALVAALRVARVRDWRVYVVACTSAPAVAALVNGQVGLLLALLYVLLWRHRDRPYVAGALAGALVALKLLGWPLLVWLLATRRLRAGAVGTATAAALVAAGWAVIGFAGLGSYPVLLRHAADSWTTGSYSIAAAAIAAGASFRFAYVLTAVTAFLLAGASAAFGLGRRDFRAFVVAVVAGIFSSQEVHLHYFLPLVVLTALTRPVMGRAWLPLAALCLWPRDWASSGANLAIVLALVCATIAALLRTPGPESTAGSNG